MSETLDQLAAKKGCVYEFDPFIEDDSPAHFIREAGKTKPGFADEYSARKYLESLPDVSPSEPRSAVTWTSDEPIAPGWYWAIANEEDEPIIVEVIWYLPHELCVWNQQDQARVALTAMRCWAGPIEQPYGEFPRGEA